MRILGADLPREVRGESAPESTLVLLGDEGRVAAVEHAATLPALAAAVARLAQGEPFVLGVNARDLATARPRPRPVDGLVRRRLGLRLTPRERAGEATGLSAEALIAALAATGQPCLPYPDRDRRQSGLAEAYPALTLKVLLWEASPLARAEDPAVREQLFRACSAPPYRGAAAGSWAERAVALDGMFGALARASDFDLDPTQKALAAASGEREIERAAAIFDATLLAGTARRHLERPEASLFLGDPQRGYLILPADALVRRLAVSGSAAPVSRLFPRASLRERLGPHAQLRPAELFPVRGGGLRTEASFDEPPAYEFDNLDEMLWWKHCRHVSGPGLPTEGLSELVVTVGAGGAADDPPLKLRRSRHRTLSFRFEPPAAWRARVPTRDGRTYPFRVLRAVYETLPAD